MTTNTNQTSEALSPDWLYDSIMSKLAPELTTAEFDEKKIKEKMDNETPEEYRARIKSYDQVFADFENILDRVERSHVVRAKKKKEDVSKKMKVQEKSERADEVEQAENLLEDSSI